MTRRYDGLSLCGLLATLIFAAGSAAITLCVTLGPPFLNDFYFLRLDTGIQQTPSWPPNSTVHFGVFGWTGSDAHFGYDIRRWGGPNFTDTNIPSSLAHATRALFFQPATAACASLSFLGALTALGPSSGLRMFGLALVGFFSVFSVIISGCGFTIDFVIWTMLSKKLTDSALERSAHLGPSSYIMVAATFCSTIAAALANLTASRNLSEAV